MLNRKGNGFLLTQKVSGHRRRFCGGWEKMAACMAASCLLLTACGGGSIDSPSLVAGGMGNATAAPVVSGREIPEYISEDQGAVQVGVQDMDGVENPTQQEVPILTFERLQELIQEPVPLLEHYAEYQDIGSRVHGLGASDDGHISYPVLDSVSGAELVLDIDYRIGSNQIFRMCLCRKNDLFDCGLYTENNGSAGYVNNVASRMEQYREDVGELFHLIKKYVFPANIYVMIRPWQFRADMGTGDWKGQTYWWIGEEPGEENDGDGEPPEWKAALGIIQIPQEYLVFADGVLQEVRPFYDQAELAMDYEPLEGCGEQAVIWKLNAKLTSGQICHQFTMLSARESGNMANVSDRQYKLYAQTENEEAEDFWYVGFGREDSPWGYIFAMNCRHFSREDVMEYVQSIEFHDGAWQ